MKSLKKISMVRSLWFLIGLLAGAALTATAESRIGPETGRHNATLTLISTPKPQLSTGNCLGSNCPVDAFVTLSQLDSPPILLESRNSVPSAAGTLTISSISTFNSSPTGPITLSNGTDKIARVPSNLAFTFTNANRPPQPYFTTATVTRSVGSPYLQGTSAGFASTVRQLFCSSPAREDCISENLFNSNPTIKSAPTAKVILAPEPTAAFLVGTALLALGLIRRRQKTDRT